MPQTIANAISIFLITKVIKKSCPTLGNNFNISSPTSFHIYRIYKFIGANDRKNSCFMFSSLMTYAAIFVPPHYPLVAASPCKKYILQGFREKPPIGGHDLAGYIFLQHLCGQRGMVAIQFTIHRFSVHFYLALGYFA